MSLASRPNTSFLPSGNSPNILTNFENTQKTPQLYNILNNPPTTAISPANQTELTYYSGLNSS